MASSLSQSQLTTYRMQYKKTIELTFHSQSQFTTGWRRVIGSPKLQIIFHKRATKYKSLLQKMTYKDKGSYESSPPCTYDMQMWNDYRTDFSEDETQLNCHFKVNSLLILCHMKWPSSWLFILEVSSLLIDMQYKMTIELNAVRIIASRARSGCLNRQLTT